MLTRSVAVVLGRLHDQRDVLQEAAEVRELLHGADEFLQVLEAAGGLGRAVLLPHLGVAGFLQHRSGELACVMRLDRPAQRAKAAVRSRRVGARLGLQLVGLDELAGGLHQRHAGAARA